MIFENLSVFQNVFFWLACLGVILVLVYLIGEYCGLPQPKKNGFSDDFDHEQEEQDEPGKFVVNAFTLKGSIFLLAITATVTLAFSFFMNQWISFGIALVFGCVCVLIFAYFDKDLFALPGKTAIVSEDIPADKSGLGKVILLDNGTEFDACTQGKAIKKGKKVIIVEDKPKFVLVKKYKRHTK